MARGSIPTARALRRNARPWSTGIADSGLPLVHHLVKQGIPDRPPPIPPQVSARDADLFGSASGAVHAQLAEAPSHAGRKPDRNRRQPPAEVFAVQLGVQLPEPGQQAVVARSRSLGTPDQGTGGRGERLGWEAQQYRPRRSPFGPSRPGPEESGHRGEHRVRRPGIAVMQSQAALRPQADHDRPVVVEGNGGE